MSFLRSLSVRHLATLEEADLELGEGFIVLTGETGAGKSLLLDALGLALGSRASAGLVRAGAERLTVSAVFTPSPEARALLKELGLEDSEELIFRREVESAGRSRAFVNDVPVGLAALQKLGEVLADAHGQSENERLRHPATQRQLLDDFGSLKDLLGVMGDAHAQWKVVAGEAAALRLTEQERAQRLDLYQFQQKELAAADLQPGEDGDLEKELPALKNAEKVREYSALAQQALDGEEASVSQNLSTVRKALEGLGNLGLSVGEVLEHVGQAEMGLAEVAEKLRSWQEAPSTDPARLETVFSRLDLLGRLKKKYGPTLADVLERRSLVERELARLKNAETTIQEAERQASQALQKAWGAARRLSEGRRKAAGQLTEAVTRQLKDVGLAKAQFRVVVADLPGKELTAQGADSVEFFFSPNPGEGDHAMAQVASGGELSRLMLALRSAASSVDRTRLLIFDEIDAGVGADHGAALGKKLATLARGRQVICVTHLPTLATWAADHWVVKKDTRQGRTKTTFERVKGEARVLEISRLLGSTDGASDIGLAHAKDLLATAQGRP